MLQIFLMCLCVIAGPAAPGLNHNPSNAQINSPDSGLVLYVFTGSDWCANCRRFDRKVLRDSGFIRSIAHENIRIEVLDFPQRKKLSDQTVAYNRAMSEKLGFRNVFPTIVLYSGNGKQRTLYYRNEAGTEFGALVLDELKHLNE